VASFILSATIHVNPRSVWPFVLMGDGIAFLLEWLCGRMEGMAHFGALFRSLQSVTVAGRKSLNVSANRVPPKKRPHSVRTLPQELVRQMQQQNAVVKRIQIVRNTK
jgi:hypothetical protein